MVRYRLVFTKILIQFEIITIVSVYIRNYGFFKKASEFLSFIAISYNSVGALELISILFFKKILNNSFETFNTLFNHFSFETLNFQKILFKNFHHCVCF